MQQKIDRLLRPGEKLLWLGKPKKRRFPSVSGFFMNWIIILFLVILLKDSEETITSLINLTFSKSVSAPEFRQAPFYAIIIFSLAFLLLAAGKILIFRYNEKHRRKNTIYAVTSERVIRYIEDNFRKSVMIDLDRLYHLEVHEAADGAGAIHFSGHRIHGKMLDPSGEDDRPGFSVIDNVAEVVEIIRRARKSKGVA